jgi:hypothetical protein
MKLKLHLLQLNTDPEIFIGGANPASCSVVTKVFVMWTSGNVADA